MALIKEICEWIYFIPMWLSPWSKVLEMSFNIDIGFVLADVWVWGLNFKIIITVLAKIIKIAETVIDIL